VVARRKVFAARAGLPPPPFKDSQLGEAHFFLHQSRGAINESHSMAYAGKWKFLTLGIIAFAIVLADQATKWLILSRIPVDHGFELIPGFLNIVHVRNPGSAFGMFADSSSGFRGLFFVLISIAAVGTIGYLVAASRELDRFLLFGYACFFGGALGNLVDRIRFGEVVDFLDFHVGSLHWPAFNVADTMLCVGIGFFFIHLLTTREGR
jgi:signal peptidase II